MIREIKPDDKEQLLKLYMQLHENTIPEDSDSLNVLWDAILGDPNHHIIVAEEDGQIISSCVCVVILNLTRNLRPYALIENVVTDINYRKKGFASDCLDYAKKIAMANNCYKMMLLTGSKEERTLHFYQQAGYNNNDKTAFIQWLR